MNDLNRIQKLAHIMWYMTLICIIILSVTYMGIWAYPSVARRTIGQEIFGMSNIPLNGPEVLAAIFLGAIPLLIILYGLFNVLRIFKIFGNRTFFSEKAGIYISRLGISLFYLAPTQITIRALSSAIFSLTNPSGQREIAISLSSTDIVAIIIGLLIYMIGKIFAEAARIAEENGQFI